MAIPNLGAATWSGIQITNNVTAATRTFAYGTLDKGSTAERTQGVMEFVGRTYPIVEFGATIREEYSLNIHVPQGGGFYTQDVNFLRGIAAHNGTVSVMDARGRNITGVVTKWSDADDKIGTTFSLTVLRTA